MDAKKFFFRTLPITLVVGAGIYMTVNYIRKKVIYNRIMQEGARKEELNISKTTISDTQATDLANAIYKALKGWGTDEDAVYNALNNLNSNDILFVEQKFGTKDGMTMRAYIKDDIDENSKDFARIRSLYQNVGLNL